MMKHPSKVLPFIFLALRATVFAAVALFHLPPLGGTMTHRLGSIILNFVPSFLLLPS